jgi:hypothetical protein
MDTNEHIRYLKRQEIDTARWDRCVAQSPNGWLYMQSFFLDGLGDWDALVTETYSYLMPLPTKKKIGFRYSYIPPFTGQLGVVGPNPISPALIDSFLQHIPRSYLLADILLNEQNPPPSIKVNDVFPKTNYVLPLIEDYITLHERYTADAKKNLRQANSNGLFAETGIPVETVITTYRAAYGEKNDFYTPADYQTIAALCTACIQKGHGFTLGIRDTNQTLQAAAFFGIDNKRIYYLLGAPGAEGRRYNAVHYLIDEVIRRYANTNLEFDFEGSDIPSVSAFYRKFNPVAKSYHLIHHSRLPRWLRRLI